jgi:signal transduction histidine kinase
MENESGGDSLSERRANIRLNRVLAIGLASEDGSLRNTVAVDLSVSGFQVAAFFPLEPGQIVPVRLNLTNLPAVEATAQVVWCEEIEMGLFRMGCQFEEMRSQEDFDRLFRFVDKERLNVDGLPAQSDPTLGFASQVTLRSLTDHELDRFAVLGHISELLNSCYDLQELLDRALRITVEATGAERGIMLLASGGSEFEIPSFHAMTRTENRAFSRCVVEQVQESGKPLLSLDAQRDERLSSSTSLRVMGTRSVLCLPIVTRARNFGMIYLDSSIRAGALTQSDLRLGTLIAGMAASAMERAESFALLVQREKMAALGTLTAGFLHEIGNPLSSILGVGELLQMEAPGELADDLLSEAHRCYRMVQDLLRLSRQEPIVLGPVEMPTVIDSAIKAVRAKLDDRRVQLAVEVEPDLPAVIGHADHLRQVVLNLLSNAAHASGHKLGGRVSVKLARGVQGVVLTVADNGPGIPQENLARLFNPFFTTKGPEDGTGLGLSIIARILSEHNGTIRAGNLPEGGAIFTVTLPAPTSDQAASDQAATA